MPVLALIGFLILYGSLYPFNFTASPPDALARLFSNWQLFTTRGDLLGNIGLFVPWSIAGMLALSKHYTLRKAFSLIFLGGLFLALLAQILQIWVPSRDATLADVFWNLVGTALGAMPATYLVQRLNKSATKTVSWTVPAAILGGVVLAQWLPLIPSLDLQLVKDQIKSLITNPSVSIGTLFMQAGTAVLAGYLIDELKGKRSSLAWLGLLVVALTFGKLFLHGVPVDLSTPLGLVAGMALWWLLTKTPSLKNETVVFFTLISAYTVSALSPYSFQSEPTAVSWLPFSALLEGSMLANLRAMIGNIVLFGGMLFIGAKSAGKALPLGFALALWVFFLELLQTLLIGRTSDMTEPLLVLLVSYLLDAVQKAISAPVELPPPLATTDHPHPQPQKLERAGAMHRSAFLPPRLLVSMQVGVVAMLITIGIKTVLKAPGIPYNVTELFRGNGSVIFITLFSLALLWAGAGSVWLARRLVQTRWPGLMLAPLTLLVGMVSLALLWGGVTTESIEDISGSANLFWFVTNQETWGSTWKSIFLTLNSPDEISFLEHTIRYCALYAPLPVFLALAITVRKAPTLWRDTPGKGFALMSSALLLLWLSKAIAFDWTSTDNLNELIARDGEWGWGGGGYLYGLLALFALNALIMVEAIETKRLLWFGLGLLASVGALPLGWWLLNQGLDPTVEKYGQVFSGAQFLLGPDRSHIMSTDVLFLRWCVVQLAGVLTIATGISLGSKWGNAGEVVQRPPNP
jgi:VanZ family protein